jgi:antitoxin component YwqK of YwqJK toxin-antitoxin module
MHGKQISWYDKGTKTSEHNYVNDVLHGKSIIWDHKYGTKIESVYSNGMLESINT